MDINDIAPPVVSMGIYASILTYVIVRLVGVLIVILLPDVALYVLNLFLGQG